MTTTKHIGTTAEQRALAFLLKKGLRLRDQNYLCKQGELDLIMNDQDVIVFVEVRKRKHQQYGAGLDSVQRPKQHKLFQAATAYLLEKDLYDKVYCRFDIISINEQGDMHWVKNAFERDYDGR